MPSAKLIFNVVHLGEPTETQAAQCTITSGDVKASAQATVTTRLDGVCETGKVNASSVKMEYHFAKPKMLSVPMMTAFQLLESRLLIEIYHIRLVLSQIQNPTFSAIQHSQFMFPHVNLNPTLYHKISPPPPAKPKESWNTSTLSPPDTNTWGGVDQLRNISTTESAPTRNESTTPSTFDQVYHTTTAPTTTAPTTEKITQRQNLFPLLKSMPTSRKILTGPRDFEIHKFNNSILSGNEVQVFTYFWKIENYTQKLKSLDRNSTELYSPAFVISGFNLRIKASLNHLNRDYLYLKLEQIPKDQSADVSSVILETGDMFHEIEADTMFRYKITVLDQSTEKNDLISQEFSDTNSGFMIPSDALTSTDRYTKDNLILIKVILYL